MIARKIYSGKSNALEVYPMKSPENIGQMDDVPT
jgi:hypothetical protein